MNNFALEMKEYINVNGSYIMNASIMFFGIIASFLTASVNKSIQRTGLVIVGILFNVLTWCVYGDFKLLIWTIVISLLTIVACFFLISKREIVSRRRIDKMIRSFTAGADRYKPICIFGGDLDFFGDYIPSTHTNGKKHILKKSIQNNKQYNQLKEMGFRKINILAEKPDSDNDADCRTRIRIGYLKENLKDNLNIKFFESRSCRDCSEENTCLMCEECNKCPKSERCRRSKVQKCDKLAKYSKYKCYNPDTLLRGRIVTRKSDSSISAAIVATYKAGKSYVLKEYSSATKECSIYQIIWDVWWKKCSVDDEFIKKCVREFKELEEGGNR